MMVPRTIRLTIWCVQTLQEEVMPKKPESEIPAKFFADMGEKCGEEMAKMFADFRPSISRKSGHKIFHEKLATNSAGREIKLKGGKRPPPPRFQPY